MNVRACIAAVFAAVAAHSCSCGVDLDTKMFVCSTADDCAEGFVCSRGVCTTDAGTGGGSGGGVEDSGVPDSGEPDAGEPDGGAPDGGPPDAGPVDAGFSDGAICQLGSECGSGFCVDGVCCASACAGPCLQCVPGTGACVAAPLRDADPACYPFVCGAGACATTCVTPADCAPGIRCGTSSRCVPKAGRLRDSFDAGSVDTRLWESYGSAGTSLAISGGVVEVSVGPLALDEYAGLFTFSTWDLTDSGVTLDLLGLGDRTEGLLAFLAVRPNPKDFYSFNVEHDIIYIDARRDGGQAGGDYLSLDTRVVRRLRVSESGGQLAFDFSDGGSTWVRVFVTTPMFSVAETKWDFGAGRYVPSDGGIAVVGFDNVNVP